MKRVFVLFAIALFMQNPASAQTVYDDNYVENPNYLQGNKYLQNSQYSSAITEFKKAIRTNPNDTSALIGLSNAYNLRAVYYNNTAKNIDNAISDIKSALFFMKYYAGETVSSAEQSITAMEKNLSALESAKGTITDDKRLDSAKASRIKGEFASSAYDYYRLLNNEKYKKEANIALGDIYNIFNRPEKAVNFYKTVIAEDKNDTDTHLKLARIYEQLENYGSALNEYNYALNNSSEREDILMSLEKIWQKKTDENSKDAEAHANLGVVLQKEKRYDEALAEYKKAESLNPGSINTKINIGSLYQEQQKYDSALSIYNAILETEPNNTDVLLYKGECLKYLNRNDEAQEVYKNILNINPENTAAKAELFEIIKTTMPADKIFDYMYQNLQETPPTADKYYEFAYELHKADKLDDAIAYYKKTIELDKTKTDAYINLSQIYRQAKNYTEAYNIIKQAKELAPGNQLVKKQFDVIVQENTANSINAASNFYESGDYQKAIELYQKIIPPTAGSLIGIAASYQSLNDKNQAISYYKKAMELDNKNADLPYYIAALYVDNNDIENAKTYLAMALSKNPDSTQAKELSKYINAKQTEDILPQAVELFEKQKYNESILLLDKVLKLDASNANAYYYRALAYDALNNYQKAVSDYKSVLKYAPDMITAYYLLGVDYDNLNSPVSAKQNYQKYVELSKQDDEYKKYAQARINEIK